jgi:hypothetical protein
MVAAALPRLPCDVQQAVTSMIVAMYKMVRTTAAASQSDHFHAVLYAGGPAVEVLQMQLASMSGASQPELA